MDDSAFAQQEQVGEGGGVALLEEYPTEAEHDPSKSEWESLTELRLLFLPIVGIASVQDDDGWVAGTFAKAIRAGMY